MIPPPMPVAEGDESATLDDSTAPTTPEGSLSFSPELRPQGDSAYPALQSQNIRSGAVLSLALLDAASRAPPVRNICCVGAGFVGGPTAAVVAFHNPHIRVTVVDRDESRVRRWNSAHPPIYEPGLSDVLRIARDGSKERQPNLVFTTDLPTSVSEADVVLIAVNTPTKSHGRGAGEATDMAAFEAVTELVARHANPGTIIVEKSTVPCRTAKLVRDTLAIHRPGVHFDVLSNPEFLAAGTAVADLLHADRILIGSSNTPSGHRAAAALASLYASWIPQSRIITTNVFSSELAKLVANAMLAQRISSINSIAAVCDETGADVDEVARAIGADPRIGRQFLRAGIGFGGSCFKKDVLSLVYLAETLVLPEVADYWRAVIAMNDFARNRFVSRVVKGLNNTLAGKKVTVLGYAFKKDTNDTRESPALDIIRSLAEEGPREIAIFDPLCIPAQIMDEVSGFAGLRALQSRGGRVAVYADAYAACQGSHAVLITTEFDEFKNTPSERTLEKYSPVSEHTESDGLQFPTGPSAQTSPNTENDPLHCFNPMPPCPEDCPDCQVQNISKAPSYRAEDSVPKTRLDWRKVHRHMKPPHLVFDGRGVLDIASMERIGFRVRSVGRRTGTAVI